LYNQMGTLMENPPAAKPVIKGIFVNSHIKAVAKAKGRAGLAELARRFGKPLRYGNLQNIPVAEEVRLIEAALQVLSPRPIPKKQLPYEAGRLHFQNFSQTSYGRILLNTLPKNFKRLMLNAKYIAQHVFKGVIFTSFDDGPKAVSVIMENNDYPIEHFRGLFAEWMDYFGLKGNVTASRIDNRSYKYRMSWK
jgi:uncharacterized protein (TIGR02265 family)